MTSPSDRLGAAEALFKQFQEILQSESCQSLTAIVNENSELRKHKDSLEITNTMNLASIGKLTREIELSLEKTSSLSAEIETLKTSRDKIAATLNDHKKSAEEKSKQLQDKTEEVSSLTAKLKQEEAKNEKLKKVASDKKKAEEEIAALRLVLSTRSERLEDLESFRFKLKVPQKEELCRHLQDIFESLDALAQNQFGELDESIISKPEHWDAISKYDIPLPPTNTANAKAMRRAALLSICADTLERHIFQSSHLLDSNDQLSEFLDEVAKREPEREAQIRSLLLPVQHEKLKGEPEFQYARVDLAMVDVITCVRPLLTIDKLAVFKSALGQIFVDACELWRRVQELKDKITPLMDLDDVAHWTLVSPKRLPTSKKPNQATNGNVRTAGDTSKTAKQPQANKTKIVKEDIEIVLWPAFIISENEESKLFMKGYAILDSELTDARKEQIEAQMQGLRRTARQNNRSTRRRPSVTQVQHTTTVGQVENNGRRAFLSEGGGGGSSVAVK